MGLRSEEPIDIVTPFVLLSTQRSGTSWIMERLTNNPQVGGYGELLLRGVEGRPNWPPGAVDRPFYTLYLKEHGADGSLAAAHRHLFRYLDHLYEPRRGLRAIGFKVMYDQVARYPEILAYFRWRRVRVLHLIRANLLDILLSREVLAERSTAHATSAQQRESISVWVDTKSLRAQLTRIRREQQVARVVVRSLGLPVRELTYENLVADESLLHDALRFLGVPDVSGENLSPSLVKLAPALHRDSISNFAEVTAALSGSTFERLLRP